MELVYLWVKKFRNFENQGFTFSSRFDIKFDHEKVDHTRKVVGTLQILSREDFVDIFPDNVKITGIIGENGSGKTSILDLLQDCSAVEAVFMIFYSSLENKFIFQNISKVDNRSEYTIDEFRQPQEVLLSTFKTMNMTSIYYKNILEEANEIIYNTDEYLENKYNISSSYLLGKTNFYRPADEGSRQKISFKHIYNTYYSDDILKSVALFNDKSTDVKLPFSMPSEMSILCKNIVKSKQNKLFHKLFESLTLVFDTEEFFSEVKDVIFDIQPEYLLELRSSYGKKKEITLEDTDAVLLKMSMHISIHQQIPEYLYKKYANPLRLIYETIEKLGTFEDRILLNLIHHFLIDTIKNAPYRKEVFYSFQEKLLNRLKNNIQLHLEYKHDSFIKSKMDVVVVDIDKVIKDLYMILKMSSVAGEEKYFQNADQLIDILSNNFINNVGNNNVHIDINNFNYELLKYYNNLVMVGEQFLFFEWFPKLSSGQLSHITFYSRLYQLLRHPLEYQKLNKNILLLIDEGDLTLHPQWQKMYISWLVDFLSKNFKNDYKFHVLITSHSSFISSDLFKKDQIFLKNIEDNSKVKDLTQKLTIENTFGANIHTLLSDGFFMSNGLMGDYAQKTIEDIICCLNDCCKDKCKYTQKEIKNIISKIGEDFLRKKLFDMYSVKYSKNIQKEYLESQLKEIQQKIKKIDDAQD